MFEKLKLNIYSKSIVGFAYEFGEDKNTAKLTMQLYLVIKQNDEFKFIDYKKFKYYTFDILYSIADEYKAQPVSHYVGHDLGKQLKKKRASK